MANGRRLPGVEADPLTVEELIERFWRWAEQHYRHTDGTPTSELRDYKNTLRPLRHLYGGTPAVEFGPLALKAVRQLMAGGNAHPRYGPQPPLSRGVINQRVGRIVRMFKWAVSEELAPETVHRALATVSGLERGRTEARESLPVLPVPDAFVEATLPHVLPPVRAMIQLQRLAGMCPGEVCLMRPCDLDTTGEVWLYRPQRHKTEHRGKERIIAIGPQAQEVIRPFLTLTLAAFLFSPRRAMEEKRAGQRVVRKTKVQPSQRKRRKRKPAKQPGERYTTCSFDAAIRRACEKAGVPHWHPHQLRHTHATEVRRRFGLEAAQVALGHSQANVTEVYAERDLTLAVKVASQIG